MEKTGLITIRDLIFEGEQDPDWIAIASPGYRPLTYQALRMQMLSVVKDLMGRGFHRNDRIAIITPPGPETAVCIISVMAGFTAVPLNPQLREREYYRIFSRMGIKAIIICQGYAADAITAAKLCNIKEIVLVRHSGNAGEFRLTPEGVPYSGAPEFATHSDIAYLLQTSGTTADSKIISFTQQQNALSKQRMCMVQKITHEDRCLHVVPYFHGMGLNSPLLCPLIAGGTVICTRDFIPLDFFSLLTTFQPTYFTAGPALMQRILRELIKLPPANLKNHSLRYIRSGSGFLPQEVRRNLETLLGVPVIEAYSTSETGTISINIPTKEGSVGIPFVESLAIISETGEPLTSRCIGEIAVRDTTVFHGYEDSPEENTTAFVKDWFRTGDLGYLDDEGYLYITGRKKELINKGGEKISPEEIDSVLKSHPGVMDAMTFGITDPMLGEDIGAMVVPANAHVTEPELKQFLLDRLIHFKVPRTIWFVAEVPRTLMGKPQRNAGTKRFS